MGVRCLQFSTKGDTPWPKLMDIKLAQPGTFADSVTDILRNGVRALLTQAVETEVADFLRRHAVFKTEAGHQHVERHGHPQSA